MRWQTEVRKTTESVLLIEVEANDENTACDVAEATATTLTFPTESEEIDYNVDRIDRICSNGSSWVPKDHWSEHHKYTAEDWRYEVDGNHTRQSYREWVSNQIEQEEKEK